MAVVERARASLGRDDALVEVGPALERAPRFADLLELSLDEQAALDGFETMSPNGRPLGGADFIAMVETSSAARSARASGGESRTQGGRIDMGNSNPVPVMPHPRPAGR